MNLILFLFLVQPSPITCFLQPAFLNCRYRTSCLPADVNNSREFSDTDSADSDINLDNVDVESFLSSLESQASVPTSPESAQHLIARAINTAICEKSLLQSVDISVPGFVRSDGPNHFDVVGCARFVRGVAEIAGGESVVFFADEKERALVERYVSNWYDSVGNFRNKLEAKLGVGTGADFENDNVDSASEEKYNEESILPRLASLVDEAEKDKTVMSLGDSISEIDSHIQSIILGYPTKSIYIFSPDLPDNLLRLRRLIITADDLRIPLVLINPEFGDESPIEWKRAGGVLTWSLKAFVVSQKQVRGRRVNK